MCVETLEFVEFVVVKSYQNNLTFNSAELTPLAS